jgi:NAD(P)-dependent dehydrogenase (short-subunit alcohol dehydrogenase family)
VTRLHSFSQPIRALVVGGRGGIGGALVAALDQDPAIARIIATTRQAAPADTAKVTWRSLDVVDEASIVTALDGVETLELVIVASGVLHADGLTPEKSWRSIDADALARSFAINAIGPALVAKHTLPRLPRRGRAVFAALSARVGSIGDNRLGGWHSYRAAKAALNQIIRTLSIELAASRPDAVCVALHPGTVATELSAPFRGRVAADRLFTPEVSAAHLLRVVDGVGKADTGTLLAWDGSLIPP